MAELILNGILEEEAGKYYHICFFTDRKGLDRNNTDNYVFVPKVVCRIMDEFTVCIHDWYVQKKKLGQYTRSNRSIKRLANTTSKSNPTLSHKTKINKPYGVFRDCSVEE